MIRACLLAAAAVVFPLASFSEAQVLRFRSKPRLLIDDGGVFRAPGGRLIKFKWDFRSTEISLRNQTAIDLNQSGVVLVVHILEADGSNTDDADLIGVYEIPVRFVLVRDYDTSPISKYTIVKRTSSGPIGALLTLAGQWPHTLVGSFGPDPDPDDRQLLVARAVSLEIATPGFTSIAPAVGLYESEIVPYSTVNNNTLIQASALAPIGEAPGSRVLNVSVITDEKLNAPANLRIPILSDPPVNITGAFSETLPDVEVDTSSGAPIVIIDADGCDRSLDFVLEFEDPAPGGAVDEILFAIDTTSAVVTDMAGDPIPLTPNITFTTSLLLPADEPASVDASALSFTPILGSSDLIGQVEALPGAITMTRDGLALGARVTVLLYKAPPAGLIDPEILGGGTAAIAPDGSFVVDLIGEGDGFPPTAVAFISIEGIEGGDADVVLPLSAVCPTDLDADGQTSAADLAALIAAWGACP
jgi:hypothetical protein